MGFFGGFFWAGFFGWVFLGGFFNANPGLRLNADQSNQWIWATRSGFTSSIRFLETWLEVSKKTKILQFSDFGNELKLNFLFEFFEIEDFLTA